MAIEKVGILSAGCTTRKTRLGLLAKYITRHRCGYNHSEALSDYVFQCLSIPVSGAN